MTSFLRNIRYMSLCYASAIHNHVMNFPYMFRNSCRNFRMTSGPSYVTKQWAKFSLVGLGKIPEVYPNLEQKHSWSRLGTLLTQNLISYRINLILWLSCWSTDTICGRYFNVKRAGIHMTCAILRTVIIFLRAYRQTIVVKQKNDHNWRYIELQTLSSLLLCQHSKEKVKFHIGKHLRLMRICYYSEMSFKIISSCRGGYKWYLLSGICTITSRHYVNHIT